MENEKIINEVILIQNKPYTIINGTQSDGRCFAASVFYDVNKRIPASDDLNDWIQTYIIDRTLALKCTHMFRYFILYVNMQISNEEHDLPEHLWFVNQVTSNAKIIPTDVPDSFAVDSNYYDAVNSNYNNYLSNPDDSNWRHFLNVVFDNPDDLTTQKEAVELRTNIINRIPKDINTYIGFLCDYYSKKYVNLIRKYFNYIESLNKPQQRENTTWYVWAEPNVGILDILFYTNIAKEVNTISIYNNDAGRFYDFDNTSSAMQRNQNQSKLYLYYENKSHYKPLLPTDILITSNQNRYAINLPNSDGRSFALSVYFLLYNRTPKTNKELNKWIQLNIITPIELSDNCEHLYQYMIAFMNFTKEKTEKFFNYRIDEIYFTSLVKLKQKVKQLNAENIKEFLNYKTILPDSHQSSQLIKNRLTNLKEDIKNENQTQVIKKQIDSFLTFLQEYINQECDIKRKEYNDLFQIYFKYIKALNIPDKKGTYMTMKPDFGPLDILLQNKKLDIRSIHIYNNNSNNATNTDHSKNLYLYYYNPFYFPVLQSHAPSTSSNLQYDNPKATLTASSSENNTTQQRSIPKAVPTQQRSTPDFLNEKKEVPTQQSSMPKAVPTQQRSTPDFPSEEVPTQQRSIPKAVPIQQRSMPDFPNEEVPTQQRSTPDFPNEEGPTQQSSMPETGPNVHPSSKANHSIPPVTFTDIYNSLYDTYDTISSNDDNLHKWIQQDIIQPILQTQQSNFAQYFQWAYQWKQATKKKTEKKTEKEAEKEADVKKTKEQIMAEYKMQNILKHSSKDWKNIFDDSDASSKPVDTDASSKPADLDTDASSKPTDSDADASSKPADSNADASSKPADSDTDASSKPADSDADASSKPADSDADTGADTDASDDFKQKRDDGPKPFFMDANLEQPHWNDKSRYPLFENSLYHHDLSKKDVDYKKKQKENEALAKLRTKGLVDMISGGGVVEDPYKYIQKQNDYLQQLVHLQKTVDAFRITNYAKKNEQVDAFLKEIEKQLLNIYLSNLNDDSDPILEDGLPVAETELKTKVAEATNITEKKKAIEAFSKSLADILQSNYAVYSAIYKDLLDAYTTYVKNLDKNSTIESSIAPLDVLTDIHSFVVYNEDGDELYKWTRSDSQKGKNISLLYNSSSSSYQPNPEPVKASAEPVAAPAPEAADEVVKLPPKKLPTKEEMIHYSTIQHIMNEILEKALPDDATDASAAAAAAETKKTAKKEEETSENNPHVPNSLTVYINTRIPNVGKVLFEPHMSIPKSNNSMVYFDPLVKYYKGPINNLPKGAPADAVINQFFSSAEFKSMINRILSDFRYMQKPNTFKEAYDKHLIEHNIQLTLNTLFKPGNVLYFNKAPYTIVEVRANPSNWSINKKPLEQLLQQYPELNPMQIDADAKKEETAIPEELRQRNAAFANQLESITLDTLPPPDSNENQEDTRGLAAIAHELKGNNNAFVSYPKVDDINNITHLYKKYLQENSPLNYSNTSSNLFKDPLTLALLINQPELLIYLKANKPEALMNTYAAFLQTKKKAAAANTAYIESCKELAIYKSVFDKGMKQAYQGILDGKKEEEISIVQSIVQLKKTYQSILVAIADNMREIYETQDFYFVSTKAFLLAIKENYSELIQYYDTPVLAYKCIDYDIATMDAFLKKDPENPYSSSYYEHYSYFKYFYDHQLPRSGDSNDEINYKDEINRYFANPSILQIELEQYELYNYKMFLFYFYNQLDIWLLLFQSLQNFLQVMQLDVRAILEKQEKNNQTFMTDPYQEEQIEGIKSVKKKKNGIWEFVLADGTTKVPRSKEEIAYLDFLKGNGNAYDAILLYIYLLEIFYLRQFHVYIAEENINYINLEYSNTLNNYYHFLSSSPIPVPVPYSIMWNTSKFNDPAFLQQKQMQNKKTNIVYKGRVKSIAKAKASLLRTSETIFESINPNISKTGFVDQCVAMTSPAAPATAQNSGVSILTNSYWMETTLKDYDIQQTNDFIFHMRAVVKDAYQHRIIDEIQTTDYLDWIVLNTGDSNLSSAIASKLNKNQQALLQNAGTLREIQNALNIKFIVFEMFPLLPKKELEVNDRVLYKKEPYKIARINRDHTTGNVSSYDLYNMQSQIDNVRPKKVVPDKDLFRIACGNADEEKKEYTEFMYLVVTKSPNKQYQLVTFLQVDKFIVSAKDIPRFVQYFLFDNCCGVKVDPDKVKRQGFGAFLDSFLQFEKMRNEQHPKHYAETIASNRSKMKDTFTAKKEKKEAKKEIKTKKRNPLKSNKTRKNHRGGTTAPAAATVQYKYNNNSPGTIVLQLPPNYYHPLTSKNLEERTSKLSFYITIDLDLFPGKSANPLQKSVVRCQSNFERIREAWADIFGYQYAPAPMQLPPPKTPTHTQTQRRKKHRPRDGTRKNVDFIKPPES